MTPIAPRSTARAPELTGIGIAEHDRAFDVLPRVILVAIAAADIDKRRRSRPPSSRTN